MQIANLEPAYQAFVRDLLNRSGIGAEAASVDVPPGDEMFNGILAGYPGRPGAAFFRYIESALRSFAVYRQLVDRLGGFEALDAVLDFGSGYGRLTRMLRQSLPRERIWVSDIYPEAVAWQAETFGVNGLVSVTDPDRFALPLRFSLVFAGSVFSHLPDGLFQRWLARLQALVGPRGLLAFSVHDVAYAPDGQAIDAAGIGYAEWSESGSLDPKIYGMSYVSPDYVGRAVRDSCGPRAELRHFPRALFENQDLYVVAGPEVDLASLEVTALPFAGFAPLGDAGQAWRGWGIDPNLGRQIVRADLFVDGAHAATMTPAAGNPDAAKYFPGALNAPVSWSFEPRVFDRVADLRVELTSSSGATASCYARTLATPGAGAPRV
jgi:SAM-dependent methyltransferase